VLTDAHTHHPSEYPHVRILDLGELGSSSVPGALVAAGVHPWEVAQAGALERTALTNWATRGNCVAIGETGLDRLRGGEWDVQLDWFRWQWDLAEAHQLPLVLHCVRAAADVLAELKRRPPSTPWLWHAFAGSPELVAQILALHPAAYFSFGPRELARKGHGELWASVPAERRLLETDDSRVPLAEVYRRAGVSAFDSDTLEHNFRTLFRLGG
jgi:TatD DNase family protein